MRFLQFGQCRLLPLVFAICATQAQATEPAVARKVAEWVISKQGSVSLLINGRRGPQLRDLALLPADPLLINEIDLRATQATNADMAMVAKITELERLLLIGLPLTDSGLQTLSGLRNLTVLEISNTKVTDAGLKHLLPLKKLRGLTLDGMPITDAGVKLAAQLPELAVLKISSTEVTDNGLALLPALTKLDILTLNDSKITDAGLVHVAKIQSLRQLRLNGTDTSDAAVAKLSQLKRLRNLELEASAITKAGYDELCRNLPGCKVEWRADLVRAALPTTGAPAGITVTCARRLRPTSIEGVCRGTVPSHLLGAAIYSYPPLRNDEPEFGRVTVKVDRDMPLVIAVAWDRADDKSTEEWVKQRTEYRQLVRAGWIYLGQIDVGEPADGMQSLFRRPVRSGEQLTLQTRKTNPPLVIVVPADAPLPPFADPYAALPPKEAGLMTSAMWQQLLWTEKFDELEAIIAQIRRDRPRDANGRARLSVFYEGMMSLAGAESEWQADLTLYTRWIRAKPKSAAAHIALAHFWKQYAWNARGTDYAYTVSEDGYEKYQERIEKAYELTELALKLEEKDAYLFRLKMELAVDRGQSTEVVESIVRRSLEIDPEYLATLSEAVRYYLPRWHGGPGELEKFIEHGADLTRAQAGESFYALGVMEASRYHSSDIFEDFQFSWPRVKQGFADLRRRYPKSPSDAQMNLQFAGYQRDRPEAKAAAERLIASLPAGHKLDTITEQWRRWSQDSYLQGDQAAVYDVMRYPLNRMNGTIDGKYWIVLDNEGEVRIVDSATGKQTAYLEAGFKQSRFAAAVPFSKTLTAAGWDDKVSRFHWGTGEARLLGMHSKITAAALSTDGGEWATAGRDNKIRFWNVDVAGEDEALVAEWDTPNTVAALAYVPNSRTIAVADSDRRIGFWNRDTHQKSVDLTPRKGTIRMMRISSDGKLLVVVDDREVTVWRIKEFELHLTIPKPELPIVDVAISRDGRYLAAATGINTTTERDHPVVVWSTADGALLHTFHGHKDVVRSVCFSPDGGLLASGSDDLTIRVWKVH